MNAFENGDAKTVNSAKISTDYSKMDLICPDSHSGQQHHLSSWFTINTMAHPMQSPQK